MNLRKKIFKLQRLNNLIKNEATGTPKELAEKLDVSEATVYNYIESLILEGAPIAYCDKRKTYKYTEKGEFVIVMGFMKITNGGGGKKADARSLIFF
jgi:predicted transcriptional regulator